MILPKYRIYFTPEIILFASLMYYGFSLYIDINFYNVTEIPLFLSYQSDYYPSFIYFYSWCIPVSIILIYLLVFKRKKKVSIQKEFFTNYLGDVIVIAFTILFCLYLSYEIAAKAPNRSELLRLINESYKIVSWLLPLTVWLNCFVVIGTRSKFNMYLSILLILLISIIMVDRSYLMMGVFSYLIRIKSLNWFKIFLSCLILLSIFSFWKIFLFWYLYDYDFFKSLENFQIGLARIEAITSQSIFINCIEFNFCSSINTSEFFYSTFQKILPSYVLNSELMSTQEKYIEEFFPEIKERGGGLGFSLLAEFSLVFGKVIGPFIMSAYIIFILIFKRFTSSLHVDFIITYYFFRFLRVDLGSGIKGVFVFGFLALFIYLLLKIKINFKASKNV